MTRSSPRMRVVSPAGSVWGDSTARDVPRTTPMYTRPVELGAFDYQLPSGALAQSPAERRDAARLLVIDRARQQFDDRRFADLPALLRRGDCLVVNDSRVIPARVLARVEGSDRPVEIVFLEEASGGRWLALVRP